MYVFKFKDYYDEFTGNLKVDCLKSKYSKVFIVLNDGRIDPDTNTRPVYNLETGNIVKYLDSDDCMIDDEIVLNQEYYSNEDNILAYNNPTKKEIRKAYEIYNHQLELYKLEQEKKLVRFKAKTIYCPE